MPTIKFTARSVDAIKVPVSSQVDYWDGGFSGFGLRSNRDGKTWILRYRLNNQRPRLKLGTYPTLTLADARDRARAAMRDVEIGVDPSTKKKLARIANTVNDLAERYISQHALPKKRSGKEDQRVLNKDVLPLWKNRKAKDIRRADVIELLDGVVARGAPIQANRLLEVIRKMFNFGIEKGIIENNPCYLVKRPSVEREGQRVLTFDEIRKIWAAIEKQRPLIAGIFKLRLLTGQRGIEIRSMRESDLDRETCIWTIPPEKAKNGLQHRVPLSDQVLKVIDGLIESRQGSQFIFPGPNFGTDQHINNIQKAIQRIRKESLVSFVERDFRRTVASHMTGQLKVPRLVVSMVLNHVDPNITRIYDRHSYDDEKRDALDRWGSFLEQTIKNKRELKDTIILKNSDANDVLIEKAKG